MLDEMEGDEERIERERKEVAAGLVAGIRKETIGFMFFWRKFCRFFWENSGFKLLYQDDGESNTN